MVTKFILLSAGRSGSTWVIDMLNSHPQIKTYEELFLHAFKEKLEWAGERDVLPWNAHWKNHNHGIQSMFKPYYRLKYLNHVYSQEESNTKTMGFKLMYHQIKRNWDILPYLLWHKVHVIHLIRDNFLDVLLSEEGSRLRGIAHATNQVSPVQIKLDPSNLLKQLAWKNKKVQWAKHIFSHLGLPYLEISYETLVKSPRNFDMVINFLGDLDLYRLKSSLKKLNPTSHKDLIENYSDVFDALNKTEYQTLLH